MKKLYKVLATAFVMGLVLTAPKTAITSHAFGFNADAPEHSSDDGRTGSIDDAGSPDSGSSSSNSSDSSSSYDSGSSDSGSSYDSGSSESYDGGSSSSDNGAASAPAVKKNPNDVTMGIDGGQKFRTVMAGDHKSFQIYHCGISRATYTVGNADGTGVAYKTAALAKGDDSLWYLNITFADDVDTTDYAVGMTKGDANYLYTELGVSGIKINGTLALSTVPEEQPKVAHYHCNCGYSSTDYEEFTRQHMYQHALNGDRNSYTTTYE